jgi:hypothetical protein
MSGSILDRLLGLFASLTSRWRPWHRWPFLIAMPTLVGLRVNMRARNLFDTETDPLREVPEPSGDVRGQRTIDGSYNDLGKPWMGMAGTRFARNVPIPDSFGEEEPGLYDPNPRLVSIKLLQRREFVPVPHLNLLAPAWLQFMVHDWLSHGDNDPAVKHEFPVPEGDDWPEGRMSILKTTPDARRPGDGSRPATYVNRETHWWDASQIYGSFAARQRQVRTDPETGALLADGKVAMQPDGLLPLHQGHKTPGQELAGVNGNWWLGLSLMHTIFAREHNSIVDRLRVDHPAADGEWLFQKARLVNAALIAKIHTTEWTPALMNSPEGRLAMRGNWWGLLGEQYSRAYGRFGDSEVLSGIPGSPADHHGAPYAITEEFTAVYRMHSLIPDEFSLRRHETDEEVLRADFFGVTRGKVRTDIYAKLSFDDALYSFATSNPGALVLHNFPNGLRKMPEAPLKQPEHAEDASVFIDLAATDILRDRERGVPRYCAFRRHLGMFVPKSFEELTDDKEWQAQLREVYGEVEKVDLLVGTLAESKAARNGTPPGFGFSDTAFRIFILLASRRLKSDRFFTEDFRPEIYTPAGFDWIRDNNFRSVLERHFPDLAVHFGDVRNVFFPWRKGTAR